MINVKSTSKNLRVYLAWLIVSALVSAEVGAVSGVNPSGVNVSHTGVTTVFLTFQNIGANEVPVEAFWCSEVTSTGVSAFNPCVPGTLLGNLPARNNLAQTSGTGGVNNLTDIMTIPASVTRKAFQLAQQSSNGSFYYVRRFNDGLTDAYVTVTCRLAGGGARSPLALTDVRIEFDAQEGMRPVYFLSQEDAVPAIKASIKYNGTGRFKGRWEVVMPGDPEPSALDLFTEATLPVEQRQAQRQYTVLSHFDVFLPPSGEFTLSGPNPSQIPKDIDGPYKILLRVEATADKEGNSNTLSGVANSGGVAGFPMPVLRYFVGSGDSIDGFETRRNAKTLLVLSPSPALVTTSDQSTVFSWQPVQEAQLYELQVKSEQGVVLSAIVKEGAYQYVAPPWHIVSGFGAMKWQVKALNTSGRVIAESDWREITVE
ncbi:hypothetical protein [Aurantivibrio plasticivorans]